MAYNQRLDMVGYASVTAALSLLVSSISGVFVGGLQLPKTASQAAKLVSRAAHSHGVPRSDARAVYSKAGYRKPALRSLYAVAWIDATSDRTICAPLKLSRSPAHAAEQALKGTPKQLAQLRAAHISVGQAARAISRGLLDACK